MSEKTKGFGRDALIEGDIKEGQRILLVEDLTTDGEVSLILQMQSEKQVQL